MTLANYHARSVQEILFFFKNWIQTNIDTGILDF